MANEQNVIQTNRLSLDWLVTNLRWLWLFFAAIFVLAETLLGAEPSSNFRELLILVAAGFVLNGIYTSLLFAKYFPELVAIIALILDIAFAITLLLFMQDQAQLLLPIMIFPVVIAGVRWHTEAALLAAIPIILGYATPLIPIIGGEIDRTELITALLTIGVNALTILLAGALPGFFIRYHVQTAERANEVELERLHLANERGKIVSEMALTLSSTLNYRKVLQSVIDSAFSAMVGPAASEDEAKTVALILLFEDDGQLKVAIDRNIARNSQGRRVNSEDGLIGRAINTAETVITYSAQKDPVLASLAKGCPSAICAPLRAGFNTYGVILFCSTEERYFNRDHKDLLTTFSSQAIIALQNAQLFEDIHREQQRILEKEADARKKLARDLHDGPTQSIAAIVMRLNFIKMVVQKGDPENKAYDELVKVEEIAQRTTQEIRTMLFTMRPVILETQGLVPALNQYAQRLNDNEDFRVAVINRGYNSQLNQEAEGVVFAIVEEAVGNAKKHAEASEIKITLQVEDDSLHIEIRDNGKGFNVQATQSTYDQRTSLGLINMDERAELVGGHCTIESGKDKGTAVGANIPFKRAVDMT